MITLTGRLVYRVIAAIRGGLLLAWGRLVRDEAALLAGVRYRLIASLERGTIDPDPWMPRPSGPQHLAV